jgi:hypothetical protein
MYPLGKFAIAAVSALTAIMAGVGTDSVVVQPEPVPQVVEQVEFAVSTVAVYPVWKTVAVSPPKATSTTSTSTTTTTTTTTTTVPPTTTTVVAPPYRGAHQVCPEWHQTALEVGWPPEQLPKLSYVLWRESRCDPSAHNTKDPTPDGSRGIAQINGYWCRVNQYNPEGFLQVRGILDTCADLHDPVVNLTAALAIWEYGRELGRSGWGPWAL